jgi:hypothetical protein
LRQLVEFSRTEDRSCAAFLMQDRDIQRVYHLYDYTKPQPMPPDRAYCMAGTVNSSDELLLVIEWLRPDARHARCSNAPASADGARGWRID